MFLEHVALVEESTSRVMRRLRRLGQGEVLPPVPAQPGEMVGGRPQAPEGVRPKGGLSREEVRALLEKARATLSAEAEHLDEANPHPFFGPLTALGWLRAAAYHEAHHLSFHLEPLLSK